MVGRQALVSSSRVWGWVVKEQNRTITFIFQFQVVVGRMLSMSSGQVGKCDFRSTLVKYWKMRKFLHLILSVSQLREFGLGLIIFQPKLMVQMVERGKG